MKNLIILLLCLFSLNIFSASIDGTVCKVIDGDTFVLKNGNDKFKVRMADIDAPETNQMYGKEAKEYLIHLIDQKQVHIVFHKIDVYGRIVGEVHHYIIFVN